MQQKPNLLLLLLRPRLRDGGSCQRDTGLGPDLLLAGVGDESLALVDLLDLLLQTDVRRGRLRRRLHARREAVPDRLRIHCLFVFLAHLQAFCREINKADKTARKRKKKIRTRKQVFTEPYSCRTHSLFSVRR